MKYVLGTALTLALMTPALAAEFYVVQEPSTRHCTVVAERPAGNTMIVMGNGRVYASRTEAETAVKEVCTTGTTGGSTTTTTTTVR